MSVEQSSDCLVENCTLTNECADKLQASSTGYLLSTHKNVISLRSNNDCFNSKNKTTKTKKNIFQQPRSCVKHLIEIRNWSTPVLPGRGKSSFCCQLIPRCLWKSLQQFIHWCLAKITVLLQALVLAWTKSTGLLRVAPVMRNWHLQCLTGECLQARHYGDIVSPDAAGLSFGLGRYIQEPGLILWPVLNFGLQQFGRLLLQNVILWACSFVRQHVWTQQRIERLPCVIASEGQSHPGRKSSLGA